MIAQITKHGGKRLKERVGINKRALHRVATKALEFGIDREETSGSLRKMLDDVYYSQNYDKNKLLKIYNNKIFIFGSTDTLVTVLNLSYKYFNIVNKINKKRKELTYDNISSILN